DRQHEILSGPGDTTSAGNIIVHGPMGTAGPFVDVIGFTDVRGLGHIDVFTNGMVVLTETAGDLRVGTIVSLAEDATLNALGLLGAAGSIIDVVGNGDDDLVQGYEARVTGRNITLYAPGGGIGALTPATPAINNYLEID